MKWHPTEMHRMSHMHRPHAHAIHPALWLQNHPMIIALLVAGAIAGAIVALAKMSDTGIRMETLDRRFPAVYPMGPAY